MLVKRIRQILTTLVILAVAAAAVYYSFAPRPVLVETVEVTRGPLQETIVEEGKTRVADRFVVSAPVGGTLSRLNFDVGDEVRAGATLARLRPLRSQALDGRSRAEAGARLGVAKAAVEKAHEDVETARSDVRFWEVELPRVQEGVESGVLASERLDHAKADERKAKALLNAAEKQVDVAKSEVAAAKVAFEYSDSAASGGSAETVTVRSPVAGRILKIYQESAAVVQASKPLVEIANPDGLEVEVEVLSSDAVQIEAGMRVLLERWGGPKPLEAVVRLVEPVAFTKISALGVEEQRVLVIVDITSPREEWQNLGDQYRVEARFVTWEGQDVLQIPSSALFRVQGDWAVFRTDGVVASLQRVTVGKRGGLTSEVVEGLSEGASVINHPSDTITDGGLVEDSQARTTTPE